MSRFKILQVLCPLTLILAHSAADAQSTAVRGATTRRGYDLPSLASPQGSSSSSGSPADQDRIFRAQVLNDCNLQAWQFAVTTEQGNYVRVQISPTLAPQVRACVDKDVVAYRAQVAAN